VRVALPAGAAVDPYALAGATGTVLVDGDRVMVGLGRALTIELPGGLADGPAVDAAVAALAGVDCVDRLPAGVRAPGHAVVAFGALPFDRTAPASLVVPELTYVRERDGTEWVTAVDPAGTTLPDPDDPEASGTLRDRLVERAGTCRPADSGSGAPVVVPLGADADFERSVATAVDAIDRHELVKVVLARAVDVRVDVDVDVTALLRRWAALEPSCTVFSVATSAGQFVGASPELLVERVADQVRSRPLAGTTDRVHDVGGGLPAALLESAKDGEEHRLVVDAIRDELAPVTTALRVPDRPELVHLHSITHLGTSLVGTLRPGPDGTVPTALHLVARLHPTPAVGGVPRAAATELIDRLEPTPRGTYAGPVGWVDGAGDGRWMVGIRAMTVDGRAVRMTAGVGIVAGSDPHTELLETRLKFRAVYDALAPGYHFDTAAPTG
jgi:menaquinone-specific isochorismate synthase